MSGNLSNEAIASALEEAVTKLVAALDLVNHPEGHTRLHEGYIRLTGFLQQKQDDDPLHGWSDALIADNNELIVYGIISQALRKAQLDTIEKHIGGSDVLIRSAEEVAESDFGSIKWHTLDAAEEWVLNVLSNNPPKPDEQERSEKYQVTDEQLKGAICSVRATLWGECVARARNGGRWTPFYGCRGGYRTFMVNGNFTDFGAEILNKCLRSYVEWQRLSFADIIGEILESSKDCQKHLFWLTERYLMALKEMLLDIIYLRKYYAQPKYTNDEIGSPEWSEKDKQFVNIVRRYAYFTQIDYLALADLKSVLPDNKNVIECYDFLSDEYGSTYRILSEYKVIEQMIVFQELLSVLTGENNKSVILHTHWFFCLTDALEKFAEDKFSKTVGLHEIAIKTHDLILKAVFAGTLNDHDLFTLLDYPYSWSVMLQAIMRAKEAFAPLDRGITPALLLEWNEYKACGLEHPRIDILEFMNFQETEQFLDRFRVFQENKPRNGIEISELDRLDGGKTDVVKKPRGAKRPAIDFIKHMIANKAEYSVLSDMRSGKNFKEKKHSLWVAFVTANPQYEKIEKAFKHDYVTDALNEMFPERKQI